MVQNGATFFSSSPASNVFPARRNSQDGGIYGLSIKKKSLAAEILVHCQKGSGHQQDSTNTVCWRAVKSMVSSPFCGVTASPNSPVLGPNCGATLPATPFGHINDCARCTAEQFLVL